MPACAALTGPSVPGHVYPVAMARCRESCSARRGLDINGTNIRKTSVPIKMSPRELFAPARP